MYVGAVCVYAWQTRMHAQTTGVLNVIARSQTHVCARAAHKLRVAHDNGAGKEPPPANTTAKMATAKGIGNDRILERICTHKNRMLLVQYITEFRTRTRRLAGATGFANVNVAFVCDMTR